MTEAAEQYTPSASQEATRLFLAPWQQAVALAGDHLFYGPEPHKATNHHQLAPDLQKIRKAIPNKSSQDAAFIAVLVSFYNKQEGQKLLNKIGVTFGDVALVMSTSQRNTIADLLIHYRGW